MTFSLRELANFGSRPALLFDFQWGTQVYRYTSADRNLVVGGNTYTARPIKAGSMRFTGDAQADEMTITAPASIPLVQNFCATPPQERIVARVLRLHDGSPPVVRWSGFVDRVVRVERGKANIICSSLLGGMSSNGARLVWQKQCPHVIYSPGCGVNKAEHALTAVLSDVDATTLYSNDFLNIPPSFTASGRSFNAGYVEWTTTNGHRMWRAINVQFGDSVRVLGGTAGAQAGMTVVAYPGCSRTVQGCESFNNIRRFGGFSHLPGKTPFDGSPVF